jgi:low affinity Fe/Cu permease
MLLGRIPNWAFYNLAFILLFAPAMTCGIVLVMRTIIMEKVKSTQPFIMGLPVTLKDFTLSKLLINIPIFSAFWLAASGVAFYFVICLDVFPLGTIPFISMIFIGIFVAYICIVSTSLIFQSHGITILTIMFSEMGTSAYMWIVAYLDPIHSHIYGPQMVWNSTALTIVAAQIGVAIIMILMTLRIQNKKRDFI